MNYIMVKLEKLKDNLQNFSWILELNGSAKVFNTRIK